MVHGDRILFLIGLDVEGAFDKKFMIVGPAKDPAVFLQMRLDTWGKVLIVYAIAFLSSLLRNYYGTVAQHFIHDYAWNPLIKTIDDSKFWTHTIIEIEPLLFVCLVHGAAAIHPDTVHRGVPDPDPLYALSIIGQEVHHALIEFLSSFYDRVKIHHDNTNPFPFVKQGALTNFLVSEH